MPEDPLCYGGAESSHLGVTSKRTPKVMQTALWNARLLDDLLQVAPDVVPHASAILRDENIASAQVASERPKELHHSRDKRDATNLG